MSMVNINGDAASKRWVSVHTHDDGTITISVWDEGFEGSYHRSVNLARVELAAIVEAVR